jgi:hypothetical protein
MHPPAIHSNAHQPSSQPNTLLPFHFNTLESTIRKSPRSKAPGYLADSPDLLLAIADKSAPGASNETGTTSLQHLFSLFLSGFLPDLCWRILRDNYLIALHKDYINRPQKLRPLGIGTVIRRLLDRHITQLFAGRFAKHILPFQYAIEVKGGIDILI